MSTPDRSVRQDNEDVSAQPSAEQNADIDPTSPLPDVPDAGDDSQPLTSATPPDLSSETLVADGALTAGTLDDDDDRTLYEQTLDAQTESEQTDATDEQRRV